MGDIRKCVESMPAAAQKAILPIGGRKKIRVKISPRSALSYTNFSVIKAVDVPELFNIGQLLGRVMSIGDACVLNPYHFINNGSGNLCCVLHPVELKYYRGRIEDIDEKKKKVAVFFIDTGETHSYKFADVFELHSAAKVQPPLAYRCKLPVVPIDDSDDAIMKRFIRLNRLIVDLQVFSVKRGIHVVDLVMDTERATFCDTLLSINKARFVCKSSLQRKIEHHCRMKLGQQLPTVDDAAFEPQSFIHRLETYGFLESEPQRFNNQFQTFGFQPATGPERADLEDGLVAVISGDVQEVARDEYSHKRLVKPPVFELQNELCLFSRFIGMNDLIVTPKETASKHRRDLRRAIDKLIRLGPKKFTQEQYPKMGQVVLWPIGSTYRRGVIEAITVSTGQVKVRLLDSERQLECSWTVLVEPNEDIMKIPLFSYHVKLSDVNDDVPILIDQFRHLRRLLERMVVVTNVVYNENSISTLPMVSLADPTTGESLAAIINRYAVWNWRLMYRARYLNIKEINAEDPFPSRTEYFENVLITSAMKRRVVDVRVQYTFTPDDGTYSIVFCLPHDPSIIYQNRTVHSQMQLFFARVDNPMMFEEEVKSYPHMLSVRPDPKTKSLTNFDPHFASLCTWHRVFYCPTEASFDLICFDCFWRSSEFKGLQIRRLPLDFYHACPSGFVVHIDLTKFTAENGRALAKRMFPRGATRKIQLLEKNPTIQNNIPLYEGTVLS